jgi:hypothetical protein
VVLGGSALLWGLIFVFDVELVIVGDCFETASHIDLGQIPEAED